MCSFTLNIEFLNGWKCILPIFDSAHYSWLNLHDSLGLELSITVGPMSVTPFVAELWPFKHTPRSRFKGQCFEAGVTWSLHTDICYSPGQDLSNDIFGSALRQSLDFFISWAQASPGEHFANLVYKMKLFVYLLLFFIFFSGNSDQNQSRSEIIIQLTT